MFKKRNLFILISLSILTLLIGVVVVDQAGLEEQIGEAIVSSKNYTPAHTRHQNSRGDCYDMRIPESWNVLITLRALPNSRGTASVTQARFNTLEAGARCQVKYTISRIFKIVAISSID